MPEIFPPYGGGQSFDTADLRRLFRERNIAHLTISARRCALGDHPRQQSLDYWIRSNLITFQDTAQATNALINDLVSTREFVAVRASCPQSGRTVVCIAVNDALDNPSDNPNSASATVGEDIDIQWFIKSSAENIAASIKKIADLSSDFEWSWNVPADIAAKLEGVPAGKATGMKAASELKNALRERLASEDDTQIRRELITFFVQDFGGVRTNKNLRHKVEFVEQLFSSGNYKKPRAVGLDGISTTSKCLTLLDCKCPIFDARVGFSLNAINWMAGDKSLYLPTPKGRNSKLELIDIRTLFIIDNSQRRKKTQQYISDGRQGASRALEIFSIDKKIVYHTYCQILHRASELLESTGPVDVDQIEMVLFAGASNRILHDLLSNVRSAS